MEERIRFTVKGEEYSVPNRWELLEPYDYLKLIEDAALMASGRLSPGMLKARYVCRHMGWRLDRFRRRESIEGLAWIAERVTFPFVIQYPDDDAALDGLDPHTRRLCKRIDPHRLRGVGVARYLRRLDYRYVLDDCFCAQLVPFVRAGGTGYRGYEVDTSFGRLTCSLTALQFIEARSALDGGASLLPLLAAILYHPRPYDSEGAKRLAPAFALLPPAELQAVAFCFRSFVNYLFGRTGYWLLTAARRDAPPSPVSAGALDSLYSLSADGYGSLRDVERMNLLQYLSILRKKLVDAVRSMRSARMKPADIERETGLPLDVIRMC